MLERDGPSVTLTHTYKCWLVKHRHELWSLACNSITIAFISWCEMINTWCERDATRFVEMSVLYVACDAYRCDDTCQHFILVTGLFHSFACQILDVGWKSKQDIFLLSTGIFQIYSSVFLHDISPIWCACRLGSSVLLHVALLLTVISSGRPVPVTCHWCNRWRRL